MQAAASVGSVCAFFHLLRLCAETGVTVEDTYETATAPFKRLAQRLVSELVDRRLPQLLHDLYADPDGTAIAPVECFRTDSKGRTAAQLAAYRCMQYKHEDECEDFYTFIESQVQMVQEKRIDALCEPLIPDLALIALQYLDGSGRPFAAPQVEEEEVAERAASAPLARIQARNAALGAPPLGMAGAPPAGRARVHVPCLHATVCAFIIQNLTFLLFRRILLVFLNARHVKASLEVEPVLRFFRSRSLTARGLVVAPATAAAAVFKVAAAVDILHGQCRHV